MFWIKINKQKVQLPDDFRVDLIIENPLLLADRIPVPYTTSFDIILSPYNKKLLEQPSRINKKLHRYYYEDAELGYGPYRIYKGTLVTREISGRISANFEASDNLDNLRKNMNELDLGTVNYGLSFGVIRSYYEMRTDPWFDINQPNALFFDIPAKALKDDWIAAHADERDYTGAPIKVPGTFQTTFMTGSLVYVNTLSAASLFFNAWPASSGNISALKLGGIFEPLEMAHSPMFPQLRVSYFLKKLLGVPDDQNPFLEGDLSKLVLTSHYHPNFRDDIVSRWRGLLVDNDFPNPSTPDQNLFINLASFQPARPANETLKSLLNVICGTMFRINDRYEIRFNRDLFRDNSFVDFDKILATKPVLSREDAQNYGYGYEGYSESPVTIDEQFVLNDIADLKTAPVDEETGEQLYYIVTTKQLILKKLNPKVEPSDPDEFTYTVRHSGLDGSQGEGGYNIRVQTAPLKMEPTVVLDTMGNSITRPKELMYMPIYEGGRDVNYTPSLMFYWGKIENPLYLFLYPYMSYHNYGPDGTRLGDLSLSWNGPDGLLENFHKEFKQWIESDRLTMYGEFIFSPNDIRKLDLTKKVNVRNKLWWIKKIVIPMSKKKIEPAQVDLIEAPVYIPPADPGSSGGSGSSGGGIPPGDETGTCYTIAIDNTTFDPEEDYFNITFQRPGESQTTVGYVALPAQEMDTTTLISICSETVPFFTQSGIAVASVNGVTMGAGGICNSDSQCIL